MKKYFVCALAALSFTACVNEDGLLSETKGYINLNVNADNEMVVTRSNQTVSDLSKWLVCVSPATVNSTTAGTTETTGDIAANSLSGKAFSAGGYKIEVKNFAKEADAYNEAGSAFYSGSVDKAITKGNNDITVECGKAKNCRVKADFDNLEGFSAITDVNIKATQNDRTDYTFNTTSTAYFYANKDISYTLSYKYNGTEKSATTKTITSPTAATEYQIVVKTNDNGTITLTITYDDDFVAGAKEDITIDAATGAEVTE